MELMTLGYTHGQPVRCDLSSYHKYMLIVLRLNSRPSEREPASGFKTCWWWVIYQNGLCPKLSSQSTISYLTVARIFVIWVGHEMTWDFEVAKVSHAIDVLIIHTHTHEAANQAKIRCHRNPGFTIRNFRGQTRPSFEARRTRDGESRLPKRILYYIASKLCCVNWAAYI